MATGSREEYEEVLADLRAASVNDSAIKRAVEHILARLGPPVPKRQAGRREKPLARTRLVY